MSTLSREYGYYWVLHRGHWEVMYYTGDGEWSYHMEQCYLYEYDMKESGCKIGEMIKEPK